MKKIFIYYSLTGNGDFIASKLEKNDVDIRKIKSKDKMPKSFFFKILIGGFLASINHKSKLIDFDNDIKSYDEIIIGSPIWSAKLACPINTVLDKLELQNKKLRFILYSGSGTSPKATKKIEELYKDALIINIKEPKKNQNKIDDIISKI